MENTPIRENIIESKEKNLKLIESIIEEYDNEIKTIIHNYLNTSKIRFDNDMVHEDEQRKVFIPLSGKIESISDLLLETLENHQHSENEPNHIKSLKSFYGIVFNVKQLLKEAPNVKYSQENLISSYLGKENIPAGKSTYEDTKDAILKFQSTIEGMKMGLGLVR